MLQTSFLIATTNRTHMKEDRIIVIRSIVESDSHDHLDVDSEWKV